MSTPVVVRTSRYKKRSENEVIYPKTHISTINSRTSRKPSNSKSFRAIKGALQRKKSLRKEIIHDFKHMYGNPTTLTSRSKTGNKRKTVKQEPAKTCSLESIIYVGTVYKFKGYTVSNSNPPIIDLTASASDLDVEPRPSSTYSLKTLKSTVANSMSSHTMYPSTENVTICSGISDKRSVPLVRNVYSADVINIKRIAKQAIPYVKLTNNINAFVKKEESDVLDTVIRMEQEYKTDEALKNVNLKEEVADSCNLDDLNEVSKCSLVSDLNLSLHELTQVYDVKTEVVNK